jgi:hypothetical protein
MEVGSPEWIEASLAKLEQLEQERATHQQAIETVKEPMALRRHADAIGRLDAEIKVLYAQLEAFAEDDEEEQEDDEQAAAVAPERRTVDDESLSAPHIAAQPSIPSPPPAAPPVSTPAPVSAAPAFTPAPAPSVEIAAPTPSYDDDEPKGGAGKWVFLGLLLVGGLGAGGWFFMQSNKAPEEKPAQKSGGGEVIKAADVPDDTEAPKAAKGADVDRTPTENQGGTGTSGPGSSKKNDKKEDTKKVIKLGEGEDPLG